MDAARYILFGASALCNLMHSALWGILRTALNPLMHPTLCAIHSEAFCALHSTLWGILHSSLWRILCFTLWSILCFTHWRILCSSLCTLHSSLCTLHSSLFSKDLKTHNTFQFANAVNFASRCNICYFPLRLVGHWSLKFRLFIIKDRIIIKCVESWNLWRMISGTWEFSRTLLNPGLCCPLT